MYTDPPSGRQRIVITSLSYGPHGIGRLDGKVIFVRGVVPGETVEIVVREDRRGFAYADLHRVLAPSAERRTPPCPYLPRCGGCPWQHLTYAAQLRAKEKNLRDHLERRAGIARDLIRPIISSPLEFGYRGRLSLRTDGGRVGYNAAASHDLVEITHCRLASAVVDSAIASAADLVSSLRSALRRVAVVERGTLPGVVMHGEVEGRLAGGDTARIDRWLSGQTAVSGLALAGKGWQRRWGDNRLKWAPEEGLTLAIRAGAFTQVNPAANRLLVATVLDVAGVESGDRVLDLYAGAGNLSLPIARRGAEVIAVERHRDTAEDAAANASAMGLPNCTVRCSPAIDTLRAYIEQRLPADLVVLDPPRGGAPEVLDALLELAPKRCLYVSCNPATLARDLQRLAARYRVDLVQPIDLFPQSYHVEAVVRAVLTR